MASSMLANIPRDLRVWLNEIVVFGLVVMSQGHFQRGYDVWVCRGEVWVLDSVKRTLARFSSFEYGATLPLVVQPL